MFRPPRLLIVTVILLLSWQPVVGWSFAGLPSDFDIETIHARHGQLLRTVTSDDQAVAAFTTIFPRLAEMVQPPRRTRMRQSQPTPPVHPDIHPLVVRLIADLALSVWAEMLRNNIEQKDPGTVEALYQAYELQDEWLQHAASLPALTSVWEFVRALQTLESMPIFEAPRSACYEAFLDQIGALAPELNGASRRWLSVVETHGIDRVLARLHEAWETADQRDCPHLPLRERTVQTNRYIGTFVRTRLAPVLSAYLMAQTFRIQVRAEAEARQAWNELLTWMDGRHEVQALTRLCGTWKWTVHNHQNHRDHTMTLSFLAPDHYQPGQLRPAAIAMHGDTVYLRWEFSSGFQEDSLLLSHHDRRLEGTFVDSRGPYGTISGMRLSTCSH